MSQDISKKVLLKGQKPHGGGGRNDRNVPSLKGRRTKEHWYHEHGTRHKEITFCEPTVVAVSYLVHYGTLLQNATDIITKYDKNLLQDVTHLLQIAAVITKCKSYHKMRCYYRRCYALVQRKLSP